MSIFIVIKYGVFKDYVFLRLLNTFIAIFIVNKYIITRIIVIKFVLSKNIVIKYENKMIKSTY